MEDVSIGGAWWLPEWLVEKRSFTSACGVTVHDVVRLKRLYNIEMWVLDKAKAADSIVLQAISQSPVSAESEYTRNSVSGIASDLRC